MIIEGFEFDETRPDLYEAVDYFGLEEDERERIVELLDTAAQYLEHPDVRAIEFALPSTAIAARLRKLVDDLLEEAGEYTDEENEDDTETL